MKMLNLDQIKSSLSSINLIPIIEKGFVAYSKGKTIAPPVAELLFNQPPGDVHIKYGYMLDDEYYVIKIASGFYDNPKLQLPSSNGLMLVFNQKTGALCGILLDEGYLTDLRTAIAGAIAAKYLAPKTINRIGIIGTGIQARMQLRYLKEVTDCRHTIVFGRNDHNLLKYKSSMEDTDFLIETTKNIEEVTATCNLIVTTTPATEPIIFSKYVKPGTHITAVGADSPHKQELDETIFCHADIIVVDSINQCLERGEVAHAVNKNLINKNQLIELGDIITKSHLVRTSEEQISVADLTGLVVQDIQMAKQVLLSV